MINEENELTQRLLDEICEGVEVPTDEEGEEAKDLNDGVHHWGAKA